MIATDPLSLVFLGCATFSGAFLLISSLSGIGHGHIGHIGHALAGHAIHTAHVHGGHAAHAGHVDGAHGDLGASGAAASAGSAAWSALTSALLGALNLFSILAFLFVFGLSGYILHNATQLGVVLTVLLPILFGLIAALAVGAAVGWLFSREVGVLTIANTQLEGRLGKVSMAIHRDGVGEVICTQPNGGRQSIGARSLDGQAIAVDSEVVIVNVRDGIAGVQTWEAFMRDARAGHVPTLERIEPGS